MDRDTDRPLDGSGSRGTDPGGSPTADRPTRRGFLRRSGAALGAVAVGAVTPGAAAAGSFSTERFSIESFDGTELEATLYDPGGGPNPAVLMTHGWGATRQSPLTAGKAARYARAGYAVLTYDSRGFGGSGGVVGLDGPRETRDARRLITWLANRPEVATVGADDPMLGMDGISYAGGIQFQVAAADDRVDALVPRITWNDLTYSLVPNGVVKSGWLTVLLGMGTLGTVDGDPGSRVTEDLYEWYVETTWNNEMPPDLVRALQERSVAYEDDVDAPALLVQGWNDTLFKPNEALRTYRQLRSAGTEARLAFYEGGHAIEEIAVPDRAREYMNDLAVDWMDRHVRGRDRSIPRTHAWIGQTGEFRTAPEWPPAGVARTGYHLADADADGDDRIEQWSLYHDTEVTYTWTVRDPMEAVGTPVLDLSVDVDGPEARLFFNLKRNGDPIHGVGEARRVPESGVQRVKLRYPTLQRFFSPGDELGLRVAVSDPFYLDSTESGGVEVRPGESRVLLPRRPR